jgi:hypothetical protein
MEIQIVLGILVIALVIYVIILHLRLSQKNLFIETTVNKLSGIEKSRSKEELMEFLREIQIMSQFSAHFTDKLFNKDSTDFIFENNKDQRIFMHYTKEESNARKIIREGFRFADSFYKTAMEISRDQLDLKIKHNSRKYYGDYIIIISISNDIINYYSMELRKAGITSYSFENVLTELPPFRNENSDLVYQLSARFIKGYINHRTGDIEKNPLFDPSYDSPAFSKNIYSMKTR